VRETIVRHPFQQSRPTGTSVNRVDLASTCAHPGGVGPGGAGPSFGGDLLVGPTSPRPWTYSGPRWFLTGTVALGLHNIIYLVGPIY